MVSTLVGFVSLRAGLQPWLAIGIGVLVCGAVLYESALGKLVARTRQRAWTARSQEEGRACKSCNADLWGLDVKPGKGGSLLVKCAECGVMNEYRPGKTSSKRLARIAHRGIDDTRSFKIR